MDNIEQVTTTNAEGNPETSWVLLRNVQFKHLNLCMNEMNDEAKNEISELLQRTPDDFGLTLSGNNFSKNCIQDL